MSGDLLRSSSMEITINEKPDDMEHATEPTEDQEGSLPTMHPRVGHQYQAIIPDLIEWNEFSQPNAEEVNEGKTDRLLVLPIPLMWAPNKARDAERLNGHADPYEEENQVVLNNENCSMISELAEDAAMEHNRNSRQGTQKKVDKKEKNLYPLPATRDEPWNDFERESFLLALYIFGKDLYLVKKFIETKKMEDVISFYYGPFYKCKEYQRWAKCLRSPSRKNIHGQRIFTGGRQLELFSRLNRHISEEISNRLLEMSKIFKEERISFEEYVFNLKDLIGTKLLIEVVAVGKGKQDLTGISTLPPKRKQTNSACGETQQDKGLSSLSCKEITEQLMSSRLSKNKSNELFWEAVWPRLLAGGWHSEQPKEHGVSNLKQHLVFLIPGVMKFKRNKHVKGQHYFDSVSDVLNKVASDPRLLELEDKKEETHLAGHESSNGYENHEMEFMIVDTSKRRGSNGSEVRWLESLPFHPADISTSSSTCSGTGSDSSSETLDIHPQMSNNIRPLKTQEVDGTSIKIMSSKKRRPWGKDNQGTSKYLSPLQRHRVTSTDCADTSEVTKRKKDRSLILCFPNPYKVKENKQPRNSSLVVATESSQVSPPDLIPKANEENEFMVCESSKEIEMVCLPHVAIDLNIQQAPENVAANHAVIQENKQPPRQRKPQLQQLQEDSNQGGRRQSIRNRPLTAKALEAFESSFFETNKKRKATTDITISKPPRPRQRRGNSKSNSTSDSGGIGSNDKQSIRIEDEHPTGNSENVPALLLPPAVQVNRAAHEVLRAYAPVGIPSRS